MEQNTNNIVDIRYQQTGESSATNELGMREMQAKAYEARNKRFLLIKAPPASGKSRALMFIALDKLMHQGLKRVVVAVPEKSIGRSFQNTRLKPYGFFADWEVAPYFNLTDVKNEKDKKGRFIEFFRQSRTQILVCAHATLRNGMKEINDEDFNDTLLAIDEFHHTSADACSNLGDVVRRVMNNSTGHIVAMTGSYFRGDGIPVLRVEDEARFYPVTYNYYQQLNGYKYLKNLVLGYHFYHGSYLDHIHDDNHIYGKFYNALEMGNLPNELPINAYIGQFRIKDYRSYKKVGVDKAFVFDKPIDCDYNDMPKFIATYSRHQAPIKKIRFRNRAIEVPLSEENWEKLGNMKDEFFLYWEDEYSQFCSLWGSNKDEQGLYDIVFYNGANRKRYYQLENQAVVCNVRKDKQTNLTFYVLEFFFEYIEEKTDVENNSFDILQKKDWILDWSCVRFKDGYIVVSAPLDDKVKLRQKLFR